MALLLARSTTPEGPTSQGIASNCTNYVTISDGNSCEVIANQAGVTLQQFYQWNPSLQDSCAGLLVGYAYCVGVLEGSPTTTPSIIVQTTLSSTTLPPTTNPSFSISASLTATSTPTTPFKTPIPTGSTSAITQNLFWQIHQTNGECHTPTSLSLWLLSLWIFPCLWTLILGSRDLQSLLRTPRLLAHHPLSRPLLSTLFSASLHVSMTVLTAILLRGSVPSSASPPQLWRVMMAWFIRPLPATAVSVVALISPSIYVRSAAMQQIAEAVYGLIAIGPYAVLARHMSPTDYLSRTLPAGPIRRGYRLVQGGAIAGLALWCLCLLGAVWIGMGVWRRHRESPKRRVSFVAVASGVFNLARVVVGFLIWNGAMTLDPESFCVEAGVLGKITAVWAVVPVVELVVQGGLS
ncbi:hypothetical protein BU16DRAFT_339422 [Lophium mytilinum]|uniref:LysM domain-containing protein n=1 Tax=Lophium mytilinum TaxID=390894 RepID=A0A6A6QY21_9PEZI|nr:hypothetical protein BU16DRAFT_339422 [Lophium mytilinum]